MKNDEVKIFIIGGHRAWEIYTSLSRKYKYVYYFMDELAYSNQFRLLPQILIIEESEKSMGILNQIKTHAHVNTIYLSNNTRFSHVFSMIRKGVADYILKDSLLYYSIQESVKRAIELPVNLSDSKSKRLFFDSCALKKRYPLRFKLANFLFL